MRKVCQEQSSRTQKFFRVSDHELMKYLIDDRDLVTSIESMPLGHEFFFAVPKESKECDGCAVGQTSVRLLALPLEAEKPLALGRATDQIHPASH
jgi:hypothetical protein